MSLSWERRTIELVVGCLGGVMGSLLVVMASYGILDLMNKA
jgi:hypothetical protein